MNRKLSGFILMAAAAVALQSCAKTEVVAETKADGSPSGTQTGEYIASSEDELDKVLYMPGTVIVKFTEEMTQTLEKGNASSLESVSKELGLKSYRRVFPYAGEYEERTREDGLHRFYLIEFDSNVPLSKARKTFESMQGVESVEKQHKVQSTAINDPRWASMWGLNYTANPLTSINVEKAWNLTMGNSNVVVCVVDTGIKLDHEDLAWNVAPASDHYNFVSRNTNIVAEEHGTHVAGTIAATTNNGKGVAGIAGGNYTAGIHGVTILSAQVFQGNRSASSFGEAIKWGADHGALISQNSWGYVVDLNGDGVISEQEKEYGMSMKPSSSDMAAIDYFIKRAGCEAKSPYDQAESSPMKGGLVVFAAGNDGIENGVPACYQPAVAVGAVQKSGTLASFSNYGEWVDICAPGDNIISTVSDGSYAYMSGTSMACPHVSGAAALLLSYFGKKGFTCADLEEILLKGANPNLIGTAGKKMGPYLDVWSSMVYGVQKYKREENNPPKIETDYKGDFKFRQWESISIPFHIYDPDEQDATDVKAEIEGRGRLEKSTKEDDIYDFNLECKLVNDYEPKKVKIIASDIFETQTVYEFKYQVIENRKPETVNSIPDVLCNGKTEVNGIDVASVFTDADEEPLSYSVAVNPVSMAQATVKDGKLSITPLKFGQATITVTATDAMKAKAETSFVTVFREKEVAVDFYPNPVKTVLNVRTGTSLEDAAIRLSSVSGTVLYNETKKCSVFSPVAIDMSAYAPGQYVLCVTVRGHEYTNLIVKI